MREAVRRWQLPALLALAAGVRAVGITSRGLQYDDAFSIFLSGRSLGELITGTAADTMPPLYYFLLHFWLQISQAVWFIRLLGILFSLLAVYLTYLLVKELLGADAALLAALLMAVSPFQYYHAQDVRNYALLLCFLLGYALFFARIFLREVNARPGDWLGLVLCGAGAMYTHNVAVFALAAADLYLLLGGRWRRLGALLAAQAVIGVLAAPWLVLLPGQMAKVARAWWQSPPGWVDLLQVPIVWSAGLPLKGPWLAVGAVLGLGIFVLTAMTVIRQWKSAPGVRFLAAVTVLLPGLMLAASYIYKPIFVPRGFILASAAYLGLCGWAVSATWQRGGGKLLLGGYLLTAVIGLASQASYAEFPRSPFRAAVDDLAQVVQPGDRVVHDNKLSFFPAHFYRPDLAQVFIQDEPGSGNDTYAPASQQAMQLFPEKDLAGAVGESRRVYFVVFTRAIEEYRSSGLAEHPSLEWLRARYAEVDHRAYNDLEVFTFERR